MKLFTITETSDENVWMVGITPEGYKLFSGEKLSGSYNILAARILGLSYANYLRYVRQNYHAILKGRQGYSYATYKNSKDALDLIDLLNSKWNKIEKDLMNKLK